MGDGAGNRRWATPKEQQRNRRNNILMTHDGETRCISEWAEVSGVPDSVIRNRLRIGWDLGEAMSTPVRKTRPRKKRE